MNKETKKPKMTKEEIAKYYQEYYSWLQSIYPTETFDIQGKNGETLHFYRGFNSRDEENRLTYYLIDDEYIQYLERQKALRMQGEEIPEDEKKKYNSKGFIDIDKDEKWLNFGIEWEYQRLGYGYGRTIYDNIPHILGMLGIEDKEQYELRVYGNSKHDFLKRMDTKKFVARTHTEPNSENALNIIRELAEYPNAMSLSEFNALIEYALNSNVPREKIASAINENGFNTYYGTVNNTPNFAEEDFKKFKSFGITGIKPTCLHQHFMRGRNFGFISLLNDIDMQDATLEFERVYEEVKAEHEKRKVEGGYIPPDLERYGELEYLILDWPYLGVLLKSVSPDIQEIVRRKAISKFDEFDPEHSYAWRYNRVDSNTENTLEMLRDAGLMDKDTYIRLYQKALNRNYDLEEFNIIAGRYIDKKEKELAIDEISRNVYYPSPKGKWQKSSKRKIPQVEVPTRIRSEERTIKVLKKEIIKKGIAKRTKIKTDMIAKRKDGTTFVVDDLQDWLLGVGETKGNLRMTGNGAVTLPPQTPQYAIDFIEQTFKDLEEPDFDDRG